MWKLFYNNSIDKSIRIKKWKVHWKFMDEKTIVCKDCKTEFVLTAGEQQFYQDNGFNEPKRCKDCRRARKIANKEPFNKR